MKMLDPQKEEKIMRAVIQTVGNKGLAGVTMSDVSKNAGMAVGTLYTYFQGKEDLLQETFRIVTRKITYKMYEKFDLNKPVKQSLFTMFKNVVNYRVTHYDETVFIDQYSHSVYVQLNKSKYQLEYRERHHPLYSLIAKGKEEGLIKAIDDKILIPFFNGCIRSCTNAVVQQFVPFDNHTLDCYFSMIWQGMSN